MHELGEMGRLAVGIAHDINNVLSAILSCTDSILRDTSASGVHVHATEIQGAAQRGAELARRLLAAGRGHTLPPKVLDLNAVVGGLLGMLTRLIGADIEIDCALDPHVGPVVVDATEVEQVLLNLVVNARDAMPRGGRIALSTSRRHVADEECAALGDIRAGTYAALAVTDAGSGIDEAVLPRIFEPFFTTKKDGAGTGIGLAIVHGIVRESGGTVEVRTAPGRGTTFTVLLPLA